MNLELEMTLEHAAFQMVMEEYKAAIARDASFLVLMEIRQRLDTVRYVYMMFLQESINRKAA